MTVSTNEMQSEMLTVKRRMKKARIFLRRIWRSKCLLAAYF
jgi:hypothetical protein